MNCIILAGGRAERLWPLTRQFPKHLLYIAGKPVLYHLLDNMNRVNGIESITIAFDKQQEAFFRKHRERMESIVQYADLVLRSHIPYRNGRPKGPLAKLLEILDDPNSDSVGDAQFCVIGGDNVFGFELDSFVSFFRDSLNAKLDCVAVQQTTIPRERSQFGIAEVDDSGRLAALNEKPEPPVYHSTACYCLSGASMRMALNYLGGNRPDSLGKFIGWLLGRREIESYVFTEPWYDIGTRQGLLDANAYLLKCSAGRGRRSRLPGLDGTVKLKDPTHFGVTCRVMNSTIGPNVYVASEVNISDCSVENSIIYDGCTLVKCHLKNSIVGSGSMITGNVNDAILGSKTRLSVGEN